MKYGCFVCETGPEVWPSAGGTGFRSSAAEIGPPTGAIGRISGRWFWRFVFSFVRSFFCWLVLRGGECTCEPVCVLPPSILCVLGESETRAETVSGGCSGFFSRQGEGTSAEIGPGSGACFDFGLEKFSLLVASKICQLKTNNTHTEKYSNIC